MKRTIAKLTSLSLVMGLTLTGCALIDTDQLAVIAKDKAALQKEYQSTVMADYDGGQVTKEDIMGSFYSNYSYMAYMYNMYGMTMDASTANSMIQSATESKVQDVALAKQFAERGLTLSMTDEEIAADVDSTYESYYSSTLSSAEGATDEIKAANADLTLYTEGLDKAGIELMKRAELTRTAVEEAVKGEITEVTDEQLQTAYDAEVAADEATYSETPTSIESDASSSNGIIAWRPEGYRTVKHILVKPESDVLQKVTDARKAVTAAQTELETLQTELDTLNDTDAADAAATVTEADATEAPVRTAEQIQADIDAKNAEIPALEEAAAAAEAECLASIKDKTDEIYAKLASGEAFDSVMAEYGEDPGMQSEPNMTTGYYVSADSTTWDANFTRGAMLLANVGDYSAEPVISTSGAHIIYYNSDVTPGAVPMDEIRDKLYETELDSLKTEHFDSELTSWVDAMNVNYHLDAWKLS